MKKLVSIVVLLLVGLSGCSTLDEKFCSDVSIAANPIHIDAKLLEACPLIPKTTLKYAEDAALESLGIYELYGECARKQDDSIKALKLLGDIKDGSN
jgi:hypothetical protein